MKTPTRAASILAFAITLLAAQSAFAFYNPQVGRWANRDPIGEIDGPNVYWFVGNAPILKYDPLGLTFGCSADPCANACEKAKAQGLDKGDPGGTICCGGKKYPCVWSDVGSWPAASPKAKRIVKECIGVHEGTHVNDPKTHCPPGPGLSLALGPSSSECAALQAELQCLRDALGRCAGDPLCIRDVLEEQRAVKAQLRARGCK